MSTQTTAKRSPVRRPLTPATLFSYALVGLMLTCLAYALNHIIANIFPRWNGWFVPLLAFFVAVEATITYRQLRQSGLPLGERLLWRITEWVVLAILLKLVLYVLDAPASLLADLQRWQQDFLASFFDDAFTITLGIGGVVWFAATTFAEVLYDLEENIEEWALERQGVAVKNRENIRKSLMAHIFGYGAVLLAVTAFLNLDIGLLPQQARGVGVTINSLVFVLYFVLGLILLAQTQFSVLQARWFMHDIPSSPVVLSRWLQYSILLVLVIALIVILLPTGYVIGLFEVLQVVLSMIVFIGLVLQFLILTPLLLLLAWLMRLLGFDDSLRIPPPPPPQPPPPPAASQEQSWFELLRSILFWILFAAVIFFSFRYYFRQQGGLFAGLAKTAPGRWLTAIFRWLLGTTGAMRQRVRQTLRAGIDQVRLAGARTIAAIPGRDVFTRLPPRQQVLLTYLSMLLWFGQNGVERKHSSTPQEYARQLAAIMPDSHPDIDGITHLFVEARYSPHPITREQGSEARSYWERIRQRYLQTIAQQSKPDGREIA